MVKKMIVDDLPKPSGPGVEPSPCFPNFLARTTFVLVSLSEVKIPGQDAIFGDFVFNSSKMQERGGKG